MVRRFILRLGIGMAVGIAALVAYFWHYEHFARSLVREQGMYYEKANALKHVYAAAQMTSLLSHFVSGERAEQAVIWLGRSNEYMEQLVRFPKDTVAESIKDLSNNQIGITIALWQAHHPERGSLREVVLAIGEKSIIVEKARDVVVNSADALLKLWPAVDAARTRFEKNKHDIVIKTKHALQKLPARTAK